MLSRLIDAIRVLAMRPIQDEAWIRELRAVVRDASQAEELVEELSEIVLEAPERIPYLHVDERADFVIKLNHFPPRTAGAPHDHAMWSITGVVAGELTVRVFAEDRPPLTYVGPVGATGFHLARVTHSVSNESSRHGIAIGVFGVPSFFRDAFAELRRRRAPASLTRVLEQRVLPAHLDALSDFDSERAAILRRRIVERLERSQPIESVG